MSELLDRLGEDWNIVVDLLWYGHDSCYNCQPLEGWAAVRRDLNEQVAEVVGIVAAANSIKLGEGWEDLVAEAVEDGDLACVDCGTALTSGDDIGENRFDEGEELDAAHHLLTHAYWPFVTHYTKDGDGRAHV